MSRNGIYYLKISCFFVFSCLSISATAQNKHFDYLPDSKRALQNEVYTDYFQTIYCNATYDAETKKIIQYPNEFNETIIAHRSQNMEYEHVVPVEAFGRNFKEWRQGHPICQGPHFPYKGRKCAEKTNLTFAYIQADMYNLYPSIGSVNAVRLNRPFMNLPKNIPSLFGENCSFKIADNLAEPPDISKGIVARTYLYFSETYPKWFELSQKQLNLMIDWHIQYPVTEWECTRTYRIEKIQKSKNLITRESCLEANLWPTQKKKTKETISQNNRLKGK